MAPDRPRGPAPDAGHAPAVERADGGEGWGGVENRVWPRRALPFGRAAVLEIEGRSHIVGLSDLSEGGALLATRAEASPGGQALLKLSMVSRRAEVTLPCTVVRVVEARPGGPPRGLAIRFVDTDDEVRASIAAFVARAPRGRQP